ncbi:transcriptional regulator, MerR family [Desulfarculus baarsii DSM 2075]|uniref:Transcriptional regulator, MerR family n=1 Tax=Desulfarculus baarsii (strain ATCC 33931 / DSM 2075 / LMG 7858 / VKM B-1802 / 2st14) TaxID=644282 RepID=E1QF68_DESB2|nr:MerR family transcriptional regulator [Desulfarculus baarsii]ADK84204.1 transcriptional regulator, MerR family [Desulfarculus baarsii DSM 2075]
MAKGDIPDKPYYRIGEIARILGIETHVLRYWESEFPQLRPVRAASKQRLYRREDLGTLFCIKGLLHDQRYTIAGARQRLDELAAAERQTQATPAPEQPAQPTAEDAADVRGQVLAELKDILRLLS